MCKQLKEASLDDLKEEIERRENEELRNEYENLIKVQEFIKRNSSVLKELALLPGVFGRDLESAIYGVLSSDDLYDLKVIACKVQKKRFKMIIDEE